MQLSAIQTFDLPHLQGTIILQQRYQLETETALGAAKNLSDTNKPGDMRMKNYGPLVRTAS